MPVIPLIYMPENSAVSLTAKEIVEMEHILKMQEI